MLPMVIHKFHNNRIRRRDVLSVRPTGGGGGGALGGGVFWKFWEGGCPNTPLPLPWAPVTLTDPVPTGFFNLRPQQSPT